MRTMLNMAQVAVGQTFIIFPAYYYDSVSLVKFLDIDEQNRQFKEKEN